MNTETLFSQKEDFFDYLRKSGRCENILRKNKCIVNLFEAFCISNKISKIENEVIELFYSEKLDLKNRKKTYQYTLKRPIISFLDYYDTKQVKKRYDNKKEITIFNLNFKTAYKSYKNELILNSDISYGSKMRKERIIITFLNYLTESSIEHIGVINQQIMTDYINLLYKKYSKRTVCCYKCVLKEFINYLHKNRIISFSGNFIMSSQRTSQDSIVASSFKKEELSKILNSIDTSTKIGKHNYLIMALLVYYGLRAGDIANLKFSNIDFEKNMISIIQNKTKVSLTLPLIDMVKYPLLDYLKNARPNVSEEDYILLTLYAPHTKYSCVGIYSLVKNVIVNANIDMKDRIFGSRVFRHSLATNMINENIELQKISNILGHTSTKTTSKYISRDKTHLRELTLEVFYEK